MTTTHAHPTTIELAAAQPKSYRAVVALSQSAEAGATAAGVDELLVELIKIRASQLNGCAYCLRMHTADALKRGESPDRLAVVAAWWESQYFSEFEQAALALTERVTDLAGTGPRHEPAARVAVDVEDALTEEQYAAISWLAIMINTWNRIAVAGHTPVAP